MKKLNLQKFYMLVFFWIFSCNPTSATLSLLEESNSYRFYNDRGIASVEENVLFETTSQNNALVLIDRSVTDGITNLLFHHVHRDNIYYNPQFFPDRGAFKGFDYQFFIAIDNVTNDQLSYTNLSLTNVGFYFYRILTPAIRITNNASLYLSKTNGNMWDVSLNYDSFSYVNRFTEGD